MSQVETIGHLKKLKLSVDINQKVVEEEQETERNLDSNRKMLVGVGSNSNSLEIESKWGVGRKAALVSKE